MMNSLRNCDKILTKIVKKVMLNDMLTTNLIYYKVMII
jgi:hypothetical protein